MVVAGPAPRDDPATIRTATTTERDARLARTTDGRFRRKRLTFSYLSAKTGTVEQCEGPRHRLLSRPGGEESTVVECQSHGIGPSGP